MILVGVMWLIGLVGVISAQRWSKIREDMTLLRQSGEQIQGSVTETKRTGSKSHRQFVSYGYIVKGRFLAGQSEVSATQFPNYAKGQGVTVWYLPQSPEISSIDPVGEQRLAFENIVAGWAWLVISGTAFVCSIAWYRTLLRREAVIRF